MKHPKIKELEVETEEWSYKDLKWIRTIVYNLVTDKICQPGETDMDKEPQWFTSFRTEMSDFKKNQEKFNANQEKFNANQEKFNSNQEKFNSEIKSSIQGINNRIDNLGDRIDNLVSKNNLSE